MLTAVPRRTTVPAAKAIVITAWSAS
jgi:hypothetical protein